jgi:hypothetical protein
MKNEIMEQAELTHKTWHKFSNWITKTFGKDLHGEWEYIELEKKKWKYRSFNTLELSRRLVGYEVMCKIEKYIKRCCPEIKIIHCDDSVYAGSDILLIPHPKHGITIMFIPQCTNVQNQFFLYKGHYDDLIKALKTMKSVYNDRI